MKIADSIAAGIRILDIWKYFVCLLNTFWKEQRK